MTPIAIVDDHIGVRSGMVRQLKNLPYGYEVHEYDDGEDFCNRFHTENYTPATILMDIRMPKMNGYDTTQWIKNHYPTLPVLVFSDIERPDVIAHIMDCGANGYISKRLFSDPIRLHDVLVQVMDGKEYLDNLGNGSTAQKKMGMGGIETKQGLLLLTDREISVIKSLGEIKPHKERAATLFVALNTYKNHLKSISRKLGIRSSAALHRFGVTVGLLDS